MGHVAKWGTYRNAPEDLAAIASSGPRTRPDPSTSETATLPVSREGSGSTGSELPDGIRTKTIRRPQRRHGRPSLHFAPQAGSGSDRGCLRGSELLGYELLDATTDDEAPNVLD